MQTIVDQGDLKIVDVGRFEDGTIEGRILKVSYESDEGMKSRYQIEIGDAGRSCTRLFVLDENEIEQIRTVLNQAEAFIRTNFDEHGIDAVGVFSEATR